MRMVETLADQEAQNIDAYLDQMMRYLKMDGVLFPNNKVMKFHRLEPVMDGSVITPRAAGQMATRIKTRRAGRMSVSFLDRSTVQSLQCRMEKLSG